MSAVCLHIWDESTVCLHYLYMYSFVCWFYQLFVYISADLCSYLFIISAVCLHFQLFVYKSNLFRQLVPTAYCLQFRLYVYKWQLFVYRISCLFTLDHSSFSPLFVSNFAQKTTQQLCMNVLWIFLHLLYTTNQPHPTEYECIDIFLLCNIDFKFCPIFNFFSQRWKIIWAFVNFFVNVIITYPPSNTIIVLLYQIHYRFPVILPRASLLVLYTKVKKTPTLQRHQCSMTRNNQNQVSLFFQRNKNRNTL